MSNAPVADRLATWLTDVGRVVIVGVGNSLRKDDFVGVEIVRSLSHKTSNSTCLIESETTPESSVGQIIEFNPTHVLILDAALLNLPPGAYTLIEPTQIRGIPVSTHALPLNLFAEFITRTTGAKVALLAIQPKETGFGEGLTPELRKTVVEVSHLLLRMLP